MSMRRAYTVAAALVFPVALSAGPAAGASHDTPPTVSGKVVHAEKSKSSTMRKDGPGPDDVCNYTKKRPNLQRDSAGPAVQQAQCYLNHAIGANLDEDGKFGSETRNATRAFQQCAEINTDGRVGAQTWSFLSFWANSSGAPYC
ncbi:peptidoglycan-binding protein [Streptomyces sp. MK5]|uniref:peptidoglycan-binding domain-containing protein n=1 Tax=Streptomyces sp. MK5 TaxID=3064253 RepID=UPI0027409D6F|nr:peptidoglycan-binding domain-containing protein [Streptomyces sp. MK5]